VSDATFYVMLY